MAVFAVRLLGFLRRNVFATKNIHIMGYSLKMIRIDAVCHPAKMIYAKAIRDRSLVDYVGEPVSSHGSPTDFRVADTHVSVPILVGISGPQPASRIRLGHAVLLEAQDVLFDE